MQRRIYYRARIILLSASIAVITLPERAFSQQLPLVASVAEKQPVAEQHTSGAASLSLKEVLVKLEKKYGVRFTYNQQVLEGLKSPAVDPAAQDLEQVLDALFKAHGLKYKKYSKPENTYFIYHEPEPAKPAEKGSGVRAAKGPVQAREVTGRVTDNGGVALPGVSIAVKGTSRGTVTDADGSYSISAASGDVLVFSYIGFSAREVTVGNEATVDVVLGEDTQKLQEVVVTALGIKREKKALTYAVSEVGGENLTKAREINVGNALSGRVAGVTASATAGGPAASSRVIIRGNGSLNGDNQPLYVVNGMPITNNNNGSAGTYGGTDRGDGLSSINPDDIESISVLKGGTAAALYGARAANGVILITTKSGRAQKGIGVEYNTNYTLQQPINLLDWQYEYGSGSQGAAPTSQAQAIANGRISWGARLDGSQVVQPDGEVRPYSAHRDNIRNFYQTGTTFSNTIALTGGNETASFRFAAANMDNEAIVPNNTMNRKTFNLSANATLAKKIVFEGNAQYSIEDVENRPYLADFQKNPNAGTQLIATNIDVRTLDPGYGPDGGEMPWSDYVYATNPYFAVNKYRNGDTRKRFIGSFNTTYNITDYIFARARFGIDQSNIDGYDIEPTGILFNPRGRINTDQSLQSETNIEASVGFNKEFGLFSVNVLAGGNQMRNTIDGINLQSGQLNLPNQYFIGNGSSQTFGINYRELGINSLFASADISFNNYLYLTLTGRNDWFSTLDPGSNSLFYPSAGLSFVASDAWNSRPAWLDYAKVRTSWAQVGGGAPNAYAIQQTFSAQAVPHLGQSLMNITGSTIPTALTPYTSTTTEAGIEFRVLNNRLGFDLTVYDRTTTDDIVNASIAPSSGYESVALNVGKMRNRGIELMLTGAPVSTASGFRWDITGNLAYNENKVLKIAEGLTTLQLPGATTRTLNGGIYHFEGLPFGMIAGNRKLTNQNGLIVYNGASGLPLQSPIVPLGRGVPPLAVGLNNDLSYRNFNLSFLLDSRWGGSIYSATSAYGTYYGLDKRTVENNVRETGVTVTGVDQEGIEFTKSVPAQTYYQGTALSITEDFVEKADFIKLRSFSLGYNLPAAILSKTPFQAANLSIVGRNLLILYNTARNIDPESNYSNSNAQGLENFGLPTARSYGLNLNVRF